MTTTALVIFAGALLVAAASPGPGILALVARVLSVGFANAIPFAIGLALGDLVWLAAAVLGLAVLAHTSSGAFIAIKFAGAAYLIYLGIHALMTAGSGFAIDGVPRTRSEIAIFRQGFLIDVLNPKVAVFFMAFLPQFADPALGSVPLQLVLHGALVIAVGLMVEAVIVLVAARFTEALRRNPRIGLWLDRALGTVLIGLGVRLALQQRAH